MNTDNAKRSALTIDGRTLSYVDFGGPGRRPLLALHGHMSEGMSYADLAARLAPDWRVIAPDQRGHGNSDRAAEYSREGYLADLEALNGGSSGSISAHKSSSTVHGRVVTPCRTAGSSQQSRPTRALQQDPVTSSKEKEYVLDAPDAAGHVVRVWHRLLVPFGRRFQGCGW
jgi:hypothetical protein